MSCITAGCAAIGSCSQDLSSCAAPSAWICDHKYPGYNVCASPRSETMQPCWMDALDDSLMLNNLTIPGTHNTMSKGDSACLQSGSGDLIYTQTWSLRTMLDAGVRAFDIRLRYSEGELGLEHGFVALDYTFDDDVRDVFLSFLEDNPTETVIMFYQLNDMSTDTSQTGEAALQASMDENDNMWILANTIPTLGEARGRIVVANDIDKEEQNDYSISWETVEDKKTAIREFFLEGEPHDDIFRLNYMSATGGMYPKTVAAGIAGSEDTPEFSFRYNGTNEVVFEFSGGCLGIVMFDFIGEDAIAHMVQQQQGGAPSDGT